MRALFWLLALAALAIGAALLGRLSDGYVLWVMPPWRVEMSLNLFALALVVVLLFAYLFLRTLFITLNLPRVVGEYRSRRTRQQNEHAAVEALRHFWEGRYAQSLKSAAKVDAGGTAAGIAALVGLKAAHALRDTQRMNEWQGRAAALDAAGWRTARLMAEMRIALDARDFPVARRAFEQLSVKERRQISAQRLALRLAQGEENWAELLRLTRMLEKHSALNAEQARPLRLRAQRGIIDSLQDDPALLMRHWQSMTTADRADPQIVLRAVRALTAAGACSDSARLVEEHLADHWTPALLEDYAACVAADVVGCIAHAEAWLKAQPRDADLLLALGRLCTRQQLWGKAQSYLEASLAIRETRAAHVALAQLLDHLEKSTLAERHYRAAALL